MDYTVYSFINGMAGRIAALDKTMVVIAQNFQYLFAISLVLLWFVKDTKDKVAANRKAALFALMTMLIALGINQIVGLLYFRPRPYTIHPAHLLVSPSVDPSFPSDHATFAFALTFPILAENQRFGRAMLVMSVLLIFSRVYVGIHYPLDVLGGALIAYVAYKVIQKYHGFFDLVASFGIKTWENIVVYVGQFKVK